MHRPREKKREIQAARAAFHHVRSRRSPVQPIDEPSLIGKAKERFNWAPQVTLEQGMKQYVELLRAAAYDRAPGNDLA
jgi:hypothetical protein